MPRSAKYGKCEIYWDRPPEVEVREFIDAQIRILQEYGELWHDQALPKHFTEAGASEYMYGRRSKKYLEKKRREGKTNPLEYTGETRRSAYRSYQVRSDTKAMTVVLKGIPKYFYQSKRGKLREELVRFSMTDFENMRRFVEEKLEEHYER